MAKRVVDTNVPVVANGRDTHASEKCQVRSIDTLINLVRKGKVVLDSDDCIITEYGKRLFAKGQPGVGDLFYRHILDNSGNTDKVILADTSSARTDALRQAFVAGGLAAFDPSDRPFALASASSRAPVVTATDSDWADHEAGLNACGVQVSFVCGRATALAGGVE